MKITYQIESFPIRIHGVIIKMRLRCILNITCDTPIVAAELRSVDIAV